MIKSLLLLNAIYLETFEPLLQLSFSINPTSSHIQSDLRQRLCGCCLSHVAVVWRRRR